VHCGPILQRTCYACQYSALTLVNPYRTCQPRFEAGAVASEKDVLHDNLAEAAVLMAAAKPGVHR
jgi:hypothetical protein